MIGQNVIARRHIADPRARLKAFGQNPRLDLIRPTPLAPPSRLDNLAPPHKSIATVRGLPIDRREDVISLGPSGKGKIHVALGLGLTACQKGLSVGFITAAALVHELMEARDERRLLRLQKQMLGYKLLIIDELGFVPLSKTGAALLFELISQR